MKIARMILAAGCMMLTIGMTATASQNMDHYQDVGINIPVVEEMENTQGLYLPYPVGAIDDERHVYAMLFVYAAMPQEDALRVMYTEESSKEEVEALEEAQCFFGVLLATDEDFETVQTVCEETLSGSVELDYEKAQEVGSADGYTFFYLPWTGSEAYTSSIGGEYAEELRKLEQAVPGALENAEFYAPVDAVKGMKGQKLSFTTTDLDGNTVTSEELFSQNKITMVNCWGVWCPNCVDEMEELADMHTRLQEKGCGIVGLEWEREPTEETYQLARDSMEEWGTNYPNALMPEEVNDHLEAFPTTFFVDQTGTVLEMPIVGAAVDQYESTLESLLEGAESTPETESEAVLSGAAVYHVNVSDEEGPVEEVAIQFCDDTTCRFSETDENGVASFEVPGGKEYEVHVIEVPDGYQEDDTVYHTEDGSNEVNIRLKK